MVACILVLSLSLTVLQPLSAFAQQDISSPETKPEKWVPSEEDMRLPDTTGDLTLEQLETAKLSAEDIPEYISQQDVEEKGHANRLREQEPDDNTIVFQNRDGTKTAYFFSSPVKYTDENGKTKDKHTKLDNKNIPDKYSEKYGYVNRQNDIKTYFPKQMETNQGMLLENENVSVELIPIEATEKKYVLENGSIVTPGEYISKNQTVSTRTLNNISTSNGITKIQSEKLTAQKANANKVHITDELTSITKDTVQYNGVFGSKTTLRYSSTFEGLKEDIVLSENTGINNFSFRLKTNGLSLVCGEDKQYYLADPLSGEYLVAIGELIVYDSNNRIYKNEEGEEYNHHYEVTTVKTDQEYILTVVVDEEFLNSSDTVYPVYIDPTMTVMPKGDVMDAAIYSGGTVFINDDKEVKIGCSSSYGIGRGLYNFPILNFNTDFILMYGNQIKSAQLYLYALQYGNQSSMDNAKTLSLYEFYNQWSPSTVKWNNTNPNNYDNKISSKSVTYDWTAFDISYVINKFKTNPDYTTNFKGVLLKADSETTATWKKFVSSLHPTRSNQRPYIQITYNDSPTVCSQVVSGATYYLKNYNSEYLDVYDAGTTDNTRLLTYTFNGNANQQFKITNVSGGEYEIAPQHTTGKVLSAVIDDDGKYRVIIEEDCNKNWQRWYIYYRNGSYHIVNKQYNTGVMAPTSDTDYVSINNEYDYCCWELEKFDGIKNISIIKFNDEYQQVLYTTTFYNGEILAFLEDKEGNRSNVVTVNADNKNFLLNNYIWYDDFWFNGNPNGLSQPPVEYSRIHIAHEKIEAYFLHDSPLVKWSDEYYALWSIITLVESAYLYYTSLIAETVETLTVITGLVYQTVVAIKSIGISTNQNKQVSAQAYNSTVNGINAMGQMGPDAADYSSTNNIAGLRNTGNFKSGSINHVLKGEINKSGKAVGYHYEGFSDSQGCVISGTRMSANQYGVYQAKVQVNGINKTANDGYSSFFPVTMTPQQIIDATNQAYGNRVYVQGNTYIGVANNGMEIVMYLDASNKIISFFPTY